MASVPYVLVPSAVQPLSAQPIMPLRINGLGPVTPGLPRGSITELTGASSSGRTSLVHALLAGATAADEASAVVDGTNSFDPASAARAGIDLNRLLWVQCNGRLEHAMKAADLILHGGGFGLVVLDLCEMPVEALQRIPISYWHRFRLAIKNTPTALVVAGNQSNARSCAARQIEIVARRPEWVRPGPFQLLGGLDLCVRSRKPVQHEAAELRAWAVGRRLRTSIHGLGFIEWGSRRLPTRRRHWDSRRTSQTTPLHVVLPFQRLLTSRLSHGAGLVINRNSAHASLGESTSFLNTPVRPLASGRTTAFQTAKQPQPRKPVKAEPSALRGLDCPPRRAVVKQAQQRAHESR